MGKVWEERREWIILYHSNYYYLYSFLWARKHDDECDIGIPKDQIVFMCVCQECLHLTYNGILLLACVAIPFEAIQT